MKNPAGERKASLLRLRTPRRLSTIAVLAIAGLFGGVALVQPAWAVEYPSWADVQAAKANESAKNAQVAKIQGLITNLEAEVEATQAEAERTGAIYIEAQEKFDAADQQALALQAQAEESAAKAKTASTQAGRLAAQLYRSGGSDLSMTLLLERTQTGTDKLLSKLGNMSKMVERSTAIYADAQTAKNEAESLQKQAEVAVAAREELKVAAESAMQAAVAANEAAQAKLAESEAQSAILEAQLAALQDATATTVAGYEAGVAERKRIEEEQRRAAAAAAAAAAAERGIYITPGGWTHPIPNAYVSDTYGPRPNFYIPGVGWTGSFHNATDLAARCGTPIYAVNAGTVTYAGRASGYGQLVRIDHGGGVSSGYGHVTVDGYAVGVGDYVQAGQLIARVGMTGLSTGCHTHFEIRLGGSTTDPQAFMAGQGVGL